MRGRARQAATVRRMYGVKGADGKRQYAVTEIADACTAPIVYERLKPQRVKGNSMTR